MIIKGKPAAKIGVYDGGCKADVLSTPAFCSECRQISRWMPRVISWYQGEGEGRFKAIIRSLLTMHDQFRTEICDWCLVKTGVENDCECFAVKYRSLGLPMKIPVLIGYDACLNIGISKNYTRCDVESCWFEECGPQMCERCTFRVLDPCLSQDDFDLMKAIYRSYLMKTSGPHSYSALIEAVGLFFSGSSPQVINVSGGVIRIWIGREMTPAEIQFRHYIKRFLPISPMVEVSFIEPCSGD